MNLQNILKKILSMNFMYILIALICSVGILLRVKLYLHNYPFWLDEVLLSRGIIERDYSELILPLEYRQVSPPLFLVVSELFFNIFQQGTAFISKQYILRLFPLLCSIVSIPLFCFFVFKNFKNNFVILFSILFFNLNSNLIGYSAEFKQYSTEVLCAVIMLIVFSSINLSSDSIKKTVIYSIILCLMPWFSYSSFFILVCGFIILLMDLIKDKFRHKCNFLIISLSSYIHFLIFYFFIIEPTIIRNYQDMYFHWKVILPSFFANENFLRMFIDKFSVLIDNSIVPELSVSIFLVSLIIFIIKNPLRRSILFIFPFLIVIVLSFLNIYPFECRLLLFLAPMFTVINVYLFSFLKNNNCIKVIVSLVVFLILILQLFIPINDRVLHKKYAPEQFIDKNIKIISHGENF